MFYESIKATVILNILSIIWILWANERHFLYQFETFSALLLMIMVFMVVYMFELVGCFLEPLLKKQIIALKNA